MIEICGRFLGLLEVPHLSYHTVSEEGYPKEGILGSKGGYHG